MRPILRPMKTFSNQQTRDNSSFTKIFAQLNETQKKKQLEPKPNLAIEISILGLQ